MEHLDIHQFLSAADAIHIAGKQWYSKNSYIPADKFRT